MPASSHEANFYSRVCPLSPKTIPDRFHHGKLRCQIDTSPRELRLMLVRPLVDNLQNDQIFISHTHDPEEGFQNLEEEWSEREEDDGASTSSVIHRKATEQSFPAQHPLFGAEVGKSARDILLVSPHLGHPSHRGSKRQSHHNSRNTGLSAQHHSVPPPQSSRTRRGLTPSYRALPPARQMPRSPPWP